MTFRRGGSPSDFRHRNQGSVDGQLHTDAAPLDEGFLYWIWLPVTRSGPRQNVQSAGAHPPPRNRCLPEPMRWRPSKVAPLSLMNFGGRERCRVTRVAAQDPSTRRAGARSLCGVTNSRSNSAEACALDARNPSGGRQHNAQGGASKPSAGASQKSNVAGAVSSHFTRVGEQKLRAQQGRGRRRPPSLQIRGHVTL